MPVGYVQIPAGLAAGAAVPYQTSIVIPSTPIPDVSSSGGTLYVTAAVVTRRAPSPKAITTMTKTSGLPTTRMP